MKYGIGDVFDLEVFDTNGKLIVKLDTSTETSIQYLGEDQSGIGYIAVKDALLNTEFLKFLSDSSEELTDYDRAIKQTENVLELGGSENKECKLVGRGILRVPHVNEVKEYVIEAPSAELVNQFYLNGSTISSSDFDILFKIKKYNEKGSLFKLHL